MIGPLPKLFEATIDEGLSWGTQPGTVYQEKMDGSRAILEWGQLRGRNRTYHTRQCPAPLLQCVLDGELVGDRYHAFDVLVVGGDEVSQQPLWRRMEIMQSIELPDWALWVRWHTENPLCSIVSSGGEGVVRKELHTPWGVGWVKCKRQKTEDCEIADLDPEKLSAGIRQGAVDCGRVYLGNLFRSASVGAVLEVACHSRHPSGKLREARAIRLRDDKAACMCSPTSE